MERRNTAGMAAQSHLPPFLLTRPAAQSARFAQALQGRFGDNLRIEISPLITPRFLDPELPSGNRALIFTSQTGVEAYARLPGRKGLKAYCVGQRTADRALEAGLRAISADGDADALVALILSGGETGSLLHLRGQDSRGDVAERLTAAGCPTEAVIVYAQELQPLSDAALVLLKGLGPVIAPVFSPRTASLLAAARPELPRAPLWLAAFSAAGISLLTDDRLVIAARPDADSMLDAVAELTKIVSDA